MDTHTHKSSLNREKQAEVDSECWDIILASWKPDELRDFIAYSKRIVEDSENDGA